MKRFALLFSLFAPFLVCDPQTGVDYYQLTGLPTIVTSGTVSPDSNGTYGFKLDLAALPPGNYTVTAKACLDMWGCSSASNPFSFTRPSNANVPAGTGLIAQ